VGLVYVAVVAYCDNTLQLARCNSDWQCLPTATSHRCSVGVVFFGGDVYRKLSLPLLLPSSSAFEVRPG